MRNWTRATSLAWAALHQRLAARSGLSQRSLGTLKQAEQAPAHRMLNGDPDGALAMVVLGQRSLR